jgi:hypothetical protein
MAARGVAREDVLRVLEAGELVEDYPEDHPFPSVLLLGKPDADPVHVVAAFDRESDTVYVVTVYKPDQDHLADDFRTRRPDR